jgi:hypothetical protein
MISATQRRLFDILFTKHFMDYDNVFLRDFLTRNLLCVQPHLSEIFMSCIYCDLGFMWGG